VNRPIKSQFHPPQLPTLQQHPTFTHVLPQLRDLQKTRREQEASDLDHYQDITEMYEAKGEPYDPTDDGFVFSEDQINAAQRTRNRDRSIDEAYDYQEAA
jgi:hypothetical protein